MKYQKKKNNRKKLIKPKLAEKLKLECGLCACCRGTNTVILILN
jgi:hypothetical protein